jgi:hypothetical protein
MDKETACSLLNKILDNKATASETTDLIEYILNKQLQYTDLYGHFELIKIDDSDPYEDDEVYAQVAIQEDGPGAYVGAKFPVHTRTELHCQSSFAQETYDQAIRLKSCLKEYVAALETVEPVDVEVKFSSPEADSEFGPMSFEPERWRQE